MVMGLALDVVSLIVSFTDYYCRTLVFLLPMLTSSHPTHHCQNHHARAPTPHIYGNTTVDPALSQHLHQAVTILFYLQTQKQKSQEGCGSLEDHGLVHCSLI